MKRLLQNLSIILLAVVLISSFAYAIDNDEATLRKELPKLLGSSNEGMEFFLTFHPCWEAAGHPAACNIYITSAVATRVKIEIPGKKKSFERTTIPNEVIEVSIDPGFAMCYRKTDTEPPKPQQVFKGYGIIVKAEDPIICYGMTRYQYTSDGYLAYPKNVLGKNYIVSSYNDPCQDNGNQYLTPYTSIVGVYDNTSVKIKLGGRFSNYTPGANVLQTGDRDTNIINRGDVWLIGTMGDYSDLTGTTIESDKPVAVISGNFCPYIPIQVDACDYIIEQDLPMETWGYKYHVTRIKDRKKAAVIRVFATVPNTVISRDGNEWSLVKGVGGAEGTGYVERRAVNNGDSLRPVVISAKNRIAVTQYNTSLSDDDISSDPFQMALIPVEQYQKSFVWCSPGANGGSSFRKNYLNLCYKSTSDGKIPDDLEFGKASNGVINWRKLNSILSYTGQELIDETITDSRKYRALTITIDDPAGVYGLRSNDPMIAYAYGYDQYDSYGYPVSGEFRDLSKADVWAPVPTYALDCEGNVQGKVIEQPEKNESLRSNLQDLRMDKTQSFNFNDLVYDMTKFIPSNSYNVDWSLSVKDREADAKAVLEFSDRAGNDTTVTIEYQAAKLTFQNKIECWGLKKPNDPAEIRQFTLTNDSQNPILLDSIFLLSTVKDRNWVYNGFKLDSSIYKTYGGVLPGYAIQPGESLPFKVTFNPASVNDDYLAGKNSFLDSIGFKANKTSQLNTYCYFKYKAAVKASFGLSCINVSNIDFSTEFKGASVTREFSIANNSATNLEITGYSLPAAPEVYKTNLGNISPDTPLLILAGESKKFNVMFNPNGYGQFPDQIVFESDADVTCADFDPVLELTGEGIQLTMSKISDIIIDANTTVDIPFSINCDDPNSISFVKESDDETLIANYNILVTGIGNNCNVNIIPRPNKSGSCNLTITVLNGFESAAAKFKVTVNKAGDVDDNNSVNSDIIITPNPVNTNFSIMSKSILLEEVEIFDVLGTLVLKTDKCCDIDISNYSAGVYYCIIKSGSTVYTKKFEIVR
ncbi:MAG: T9SS type A sorting domain-containing protein [bacterium]